MDLVPHSVVQHPDVTETQPSSIWLNTLNKTENILDLIDMAYYVIKFLSKENLTVYAKSMWVSCLGIHQEHV